jgi:hypothetical protein
VALALAFGFSGNALRETVSQSELRDLATLERKAADYRRKLLARIDAGGRVEPGSLALRSRSATE